MFLWKQNLDEQSPEVQMVIGTLIYGVKTAGQMTIGAIQEIAAYAKKHFPEVSDGADMVEKKSYMDDVLGGASDVPEAENLMEQASFTLSLGSMEIKEYTITGRPPSPEVSVDGESIGVLGYVWYPVEDTLAIKINPLYFGKAKRGMKPEPIVGNFVAQLKDKFTRRTLLSKIAGVYDIRGLATPVTAKFKLDFSLLNALKLSWDEKIPEEYFGTWVNNIQTILHYFF